MADDVRLPRAERGRPPASLNGGRTLKERYAEEVYEIIRSLAGQEKRPVRFREVWPKVVPKERHINEVNWKRLTTERALKLLVQAEWIERTVDGYRDLDPQLYAFHAARVELEQLLEAGRRVFDEDPGGSGAESYAWLNRAASLSLDLAATIGYWLRAFDRRFASRAKELGYQFPQPGAFGLETVDDLGSGFGPGFRAGMMAAEIADGYLTPDREKAMGKPGLHEARAEGALSYHRLVVRLGARALGPLALSGGPRPLLPTAEWEAEARAELLRSRKAARVLAPERREALRVQRVAWQNEIHVGYAREYDRDWRQLKSDCAREQDLVRRLKSQIRKGLPRPKE